MISKEEYEEYHQSQYHHTPDERQICFHCKTIINEEFTRFWIGKRTGHPRQTNGKPNIYGICTYLWFHELCFRKIAGDKYNVEHEDEK